jgi:IS5 family transposase
VEEALYDSLAMRRFVGIDLGREPVPDETTVCRFRHLLEAHDLGLRLFDEVQRHLATKGLKVATGTGAAVHPEMRLHPEMTREDLGASARWHPVRSARMGVAGS